MRVIFSLVLNRGYFNVYEQGGGSETNPGHVDQLDMPKALSH